MFRFSPAIALALFVTRPEAVYLEATVALTYLNALVDMLPGLRAEWRRLMELEEEPTLRDMFRTVALGTITAMTIILIGIINSMG